MREKDPRILIVDDEPSNIMILRGFLEQHDFDVSVAMDGGQTMQILESCRPELILLDVMMPGMDGFELCRLLKEDKETADIPIIFMTSLSSVENKVSGFEAGGVDYITKPFQPLEVLARVHTHLTLQRQKMELKQAMAELKVLTGILPMCSFCKNIRDKDDKWIRLEQYISSHSEAQVSHGLCPECLKKHYGKIS